MLDKGSEDHNKSLLTQGFPHTSAEENRFINICIRTKGVYGL